MFYEVGGSGRRPDLSFWAHPSVTAFLLALLSAPVPAIDDGSGEIHSHLLALTGPRVVTTFVTLHLRTGFLLSFPGYP
jgi:hypothetical protein